MKFTCKQCIYFVAESIKRIMNILKKNNNDKRTKKSKTLTEDKTILTHWWMMLYSPLQKRLIHLLVQKKTLNKFKSVLAIIISCWVVRHKLIFLRKLLLQVIIWRWTKRIDRWTPKYLWHLRYSLKNYLTKKSAEEFSGVWWFS